MGTLSLWCLYEEGMSAIQKLLLCGHSVPLVFVLRRFETVCTLCLFSRFARSFVVLDKVRIYKAVLVGLHYFRKSTDTRAILKFVVFLTPLYFHF